MPTNPRIAVIDYGAGNLRSVAKALVRSNLEAVITSDPKEVRGADAIVLPGVGAFADAVASLKSSGLDDAIREALAAGRPYLGLCLGLQVLFEEGEEHGVTPGLGLLPGRVERFPDKTPSGEVMRVPHIGWNTVKFSGDHPMISKLPAEDTFYFVHSYYAVPSCESDIVGRVDYEGEFAAAVARSRLLAVQFHPEKSQSSGRRFLDAFASWVAEC
jgi:glutamine amidotransferase